MYGLRRSRRTRIVGGDSGRRPAPQHGLGGPRWVVKQPAVRTQPQREMRTTVFNQSRRIDINNLTMFVTNYGTFATTSKQW